MLDKLDKIWIGLIVGTIIPFFCFFCYWLFAHSEMNFPNGFIRYLRGGEMIQEVAIACIAASLIVFYVLLNKKAYNISKGIMYATFGYVAFTLYLSLL